MSRALELHKSLYQALTSGTYPVLDLPPNDPVLPLITLGDVYITREDTKSSERSVHLIRVHTWSKGNSKAEVYQMNEFVKQTVEAGFTIDGYNLDRIETGIATVIKDADYTGAVQTDINGTVYHGVNEFEVYISSL